MTTSASLTYEILEQATLRAASIGLRMEPNIVSKEAFYLGLEIEKVEPEFFVCPRSTLEILMKARKLGIKR
jgi:hypothetical protein